MQTHIPMETLKQYSLREDTPMETYKIYSFGEDTTMETKIKLQYWGGHSYRHTYTSVWRRSLLWKVTNNTALEGHSYGNL